MDKSNIQITISCETHRLWDKKASIILSLLGSAFFVFSLIAGVNPKRMLIALPFVLLLMWIAPNFVPSDVDGKMVRYLIPLMSYACIFAATLTNSIWLGALAGSISTLLLFLLSLLFVDYLNRY